MTKTKQPTTSYFCIFVHLLFLCFYFLFILKACIRTKTSHDTKKRKQVCYTQTKLYSTAHKKKKRKKGNAHEKHNTKIVSEKERKNI